MIIWLSVILVSTYIGMALSTILQRMRDFSLLTQNSKADISNGQYVFKVCIQLVGKMILYILFISISSQCAY